MQYDFASLNALTDEELIRLVQDRAVGIWLLVWSEWQGWQVRLSNCGTLSQVKMLPPLKDTSHIFFRSPFHRMARF